MKKLMLILFLICLALSVMADPFVHEGDHNYTVINTAMTTKPFLNEYVSLNFDVAREDGSGARDIHVHVKTFDDRNVLVQDYSTRLTDNSGIFSDAQGRSSGFKFFRVIQGENNSDFLEQRLITDDNGSIALKLFLNSCGINETKNCYYQTARYRVELSQEGVSHDEYFTVHGEEIQGNWFFQLLSFIGNNTVDIAIIILVIILGIIITVAVIFFIVNKFRGR